MTAMFRAFVQGTKETQAPATVSDIAYRIMYIMLNRWTARLGYYGGLFKLGLASILPIGRPKDKASIDACAST